MKRFRTATFGLLGASYHIVRNASDISFSLQPGIGLIQGNRVFSDGPYQDIKVSPAIGISTGYRYFFYEKFHFLVEIKYIYSKYTGGNEPQRINDILLSGGLSMNLGR